MGVEGGRFLSKLQGKGLHSLEDSVVWIGAKDGRFAVKCLYAKLEPRRGGGGGGGGWVGVRVFLPR